MVKEAGIALRHQAMGMWKGGNIIGVSVRTVVDGGNVLRRRILTNRSGRGRKRS